jgi:hypothetical protein
MVASHADAVRVAVIAFRGHCRQTRQACIVISQDRGEFEQ